MPSKVAPETSNLNQKKNQRNDGSAVWWCAFCWRRRQLRTKSLDADTADMALQTPIEESDQFGDILEDMLENLEVRDRSFRMKVYPRCFTGKAAVQFLVENRYAVDAHDAVSLGNSMMEKGHFHHVCRDHAFKNDGLFYRFAVHEDFHGGCDITPA